MTHTEVKLIAAVLSSRIDLARHSYDECCVVDSEEAQEIIESILMEYVERSEDGIPQES